MIRFVGQWSLWVLNSWPRPWRILALRAAKRSDNGVNGQAVRRHTDLNLFRPTYLFNYGDVQFEEAFSLKIGIFINVYSNNELWNVNGIW